MYTDHPTDEPLSPEAKWEHYLQAEGMDNPSAQLDALGTDTPVDSHKILTRHSFSSSPYTKAIFVFCLAFVGVGCIGIVLKVLFGGLSAVQTNQSSANAKNMTQEPLEDSETDKLRQALLKAQQSNEMALAKQAQADAEKARLEKLAQQQSKRPQRPTPYQVRQPQPGAARPAPIAFTPAPPKPSIPSAPPSPPRAMYNPPPPTPIIRTQPQAPPSAQPTIAKDPYQQWLEASEIGAYGGGTSVSRLAQSAPHPGVRTTPAAATPVLGAGGILPGTRFKGKIDTPWDSVSGTDFRILVTENLVSLDGRVVIPKGAYLIATATSGDFPKVTIKQIITPFNGQMQTRSIPTQALAVQGDNGVLQAQVKKAGGASVGSKILTAGLKGVSNAANLANRATVTTAANGSTTVGYGAADYGSAVLSGVTDSLSNEISAQANAARQANRSSLHVFSLKPGTTVQIIVNQPF